MSWEIAGTGEQTEIQSHVAPARRTRPEEAGADRGRSRAGWDSSTCGEAADLPAPNSTTATARTVQIRRSTDKQLKRCSWTFQYTVFKTG